MEWLYAAFLGKPAWVWLSFTVIVVILLALDLGVFHRKQRVIEARESLIMSAFYIALALLFSVWIFYAFGSEKGEQYLTGYLVEKTLSLDNIFVISLIFSYFAIPPQYQHRVLFYGILGVIILRGIMIALGATLVAQFSWILYIFAIFLIITGIKMLIASESPPDVASNPVLRMMRKLFRITPTLHGQRFFVRQPETPGGKSVFWVTPVFVALILIEIADLIFAVDSIPAIFTITNDPYIVFTSNIFAILGLRSLYFALAAVLHHFKYLKQSLALVLIFIGSKAFIADALGLEKFPASISLGVTIALIAGGIVYSMLKRETSPEIRSATNL